MTRAGGTDSLGALDIFLLCLVGVYLFILPIPHTIAVRNMLVLLLLAVLLVDGFRTRPEMGFTPAPPWWRIVVVLVSLTAWLLFQAAFLSFDPHWALSEVKGQWLTAMFAFITGTVLGRRMLRRRRFLQAVFTVLLLVLLAHILYIDGVGIRHFLATRGWVSRVSGLAEGPHHASYLTNTMYALLLTETLYRYHLRRRLLPGGGVALVGIFFLAAISTLMEGSRNGEVAMLVIGVIGLALARWGRERASGRIRWGAVLLVTVLLLVPLVYNVRHDMRWQTFMETVPIALQTERYKTWLNHHKYPPPHLQDGSPVNLSNYLRIAWAKEGLRLVLEHPLGVGYGREAFGRGLMQKYGEHALWHSHSGLLELAIGAGLPAVFLWLVFIGMLLHQGYRHVRAGGGYAAFFLLLFAGGFFFRSIIDFNTKNHVLMTFFFLVGITAMLMFHERETEA